MIRCMLNSLLDAGCNAMSAFKRGSPAVHYSGLILIGFVVLKRRSKLRVHAEICWRNQDTNIHHVHGGVDIQVSHRDPCDQNHEMAHKGDATARVSPVVNIPTARPDGCSYRWGGGETGLGKCCK